MLSGYHLCSLRKQPTSREVATCALAKRRLSNERRNSILMTRHYPDLGSASDWLKRAGTSLQPIRSTTKIWVVTRHQYGISALVTQTSFCEGSSGDLAKCRLFSQATIAGHDLFFVCCFFVFVVVFFLVATFSKQKCL